MPIKEVVFLIEFEDGTVDSRSCLETGWISGLSSLFSLGRTLPVVRWES